MSTIQLPNATRPLLLNNQQSTFNKTLHYFLAHHTNRALNIRATRSSLADWRLVPEHLQHLGNKHLLLHPAAFANVGNNALNNASASLLSETPREETWAEHDYKQHQYD